MLVILDGWGLREASADNAIRLARTPTFSKLWSTCPHARLHTSGKDVGLPDGQMGNSEVGHLNIGAGRLVHAGSATHQSGCRIAARSPSCTGAARPDRALAQVRRHLPSDGPGVARRRALASGPRRSARAGSRFSRRADSRPRFHRRTRYATPVGRRRCPAPGFGASVRGLASARCAAATMRWTATIDGTASARRIAPSSTRRDHASPMRSVGDRGRLCPRCHR